MNLSRGENAPQAAHLQIADRAIGEDYRRQAVSIARVPASSPEGTTDLQATHHRESEGAIALLSLVMISDCLFAGRAARSKEIEDVDASRPSRTVPGCDLRRIADKS
jgi:hypothetical protein